MEERERNYRIMDGGVNLGLSKRRAKLWESSIRTKLSMSFLTLRFGEIRASNGEVAILPKGKDAAGNPLLK
jgi:hypothetical protein